MASLQLLYIVSGNQARLDTRTEFKILEPSPKGGVEASRAHYYTACYTTSFTPPPLASAPRFQIRHAYLLSLNCH